MRICAYVLDFSFNKLWRMIDTADQAAIEPSFWLEIGPYNGLTKEEDPWWRFNQKWILLTLPNTDAKRYSVLIRTQTSYIKKILSVSKNNRVALRVSKDVFAVQFLDCDNRWSMRPRISRVTPEPVKANDLSKEANNHKFKIVFA